MARKLAAGNWKMNGSTNALAMIDALADAYPAADVDLLLCPPAHLIMSARDRAASSPVTIGAQTCHAAESGAHTGDISAVMLREAGATAVIVGHSERRDSHRETDAQVAAQAQAAQAAGLRAIICIGESADQREAGDALAVIRAQLKNSVPQDSDPARLVVAYEPIWAIGTGLIPTMAQIAEVHTCLRADLVQMFGDAAQDIPLLYGGSVKANNAAEIFALTDVDGALVGGASLQTQDFSPIVDALIAS